MRKWNEAMFRRYICEGRGQGAGAGYKPWLTVQDFPSHGMVSRVKGQTTGRTYHLMSNNETNLFYLLDWSDDVLDIREQYPLLDLSEVINLAELAKIKYPYDNQSGFPYVMTSDFYLETTDGIVVIAVKPASELKKSRVLEKLEIERRYWASKGIRWELITEKEINRTKSRNIEWLSQANDLAGFGLCEELQEKCLDFFLGMLHGSTNRSLNGLFVDVERRFGLCSGTGINIFKHLVFAKKIRVDVSKPLDFSVLAHEPDIFAT